MGLDPFQRSGLAFLEGLTDSFPQTVLVELIPGEKLTRKSWRFFEQLHEERGRSRLDLAEYWLERGWGVGLLPRGGIWALDLDSVAAEKQATEVLERGGWAPPRIRTPSQGAHLWMRLPDGLTTKNHICHPKDANGIKYEADFKFGPRTLLVAPGTIRKGRCYSPETLWSPPPCVHPEMFLPGIQIEPQHRSFLVHQGSEVDRIKAACAFLRRVGVSIEKNLGHRQLRQVVGNLVVWFGLDPYLAFNLMTNPNGQSWNDRCRPPWSHRELRRACERAVDDVPSLGVNEWNRQSLNGKIMKFLEWIRCNAMDPMSWCYIDDLRSCCEDEIGEEITSSRFGRLVREAGLRKSLRSKARLTSMESISLDLVLKLHSPRSSP